MIVLHRPSNKIHYLAAVLCSLYVALIFGCSPDSQTLGKTNKEHQPEASSRMSAGITKKQESAPDESGLNKTLSSHSSKKVGSSLKAMIEKMEALGITIENAKKLKASSLSTPLVKVDNEGKIQTYVYFRAFGLDEKSLLEAWDVVIEITNKELGIIQAWIPFNRIYEIAELPFVERITPPNYGTSKVGAVMIKTVSILS